MRIIEFKSSEHDQIIEFLRFACKELELSSIPKIKIIHKPISNEISNSFAAYNPSNKEVSIYTKGRHILDTLRSLCHEMVHYRQDCNNELTADSGKTGSKHEDEANSIAGQVMRKYNKMHPELF